MKYLKFKTILTSDVKTGNQVRQYDVNALYSALQDVKNGHSIYRAAQTYW
jgi:hypothetical protein